MWQWNKPSEVSEKGVWYFPAGMCMNTFTVNVGYGPTETYPCASRALHVVAFKVWSPESGSPDGWEDAIMHLCERCKGQLADETDKDADLIRTVSIQPYLGNYDGREVSDN